MISVCCLARISAVPSVYLSRVHLYTGSRDGPVAPLRIVASRHRAVAAFRTGAA